MTITIRSVTPFFLLLFLLTGAWAQTKKKTPKTVFFIVDGIPADVIQKINPPVLSEIAKEGGFTQAYVGGEKGGYSQTPTISAVGYISLLTGTWVNKHNVWDNDIAAPNYSYWNIFRIAKKVNPALKTAIFSTWLDNRTKLVGEGLEKAGAITMDYKFDGLEHDTAKYPHDKASFYIHRIDEAVSDEAARQIAENGPDISWVYLEYTDDMGHRFGDSQQFYDAILMADKQIGKVWQVLKQREKKFNEDWLIVVTTDHGRDATTGKGHGGQSNRERSTWITTNSKHLNDRFKQTPGVVDILPSIANHMNISIPDSVLREIDGVPFIGAADLSDLKAEKKGDKIVLRWKNISQNGTDKIEIFVSETNNFKEGGRDEYRKVGKALTHQENFTFKLDRNVAFYKVVVKGPHHYANAWVTDPAIIRK
ncbi:MAG: alkaline phosphatase family protein [Bacteroidota bacterium]